MSQPDQPATGTGPAVGADGVARCPWGASDAMRAYHDDEWGRPVTDERGMFERMCLEGFQAGLSWLTILNKRENFRVAFANFDPDRVAAYTDADVERLMSDAGIVRNRAKILATRQNASAVIAMRESGGIVEFVRGFKPATTPAPEVAEEVPTVSVESTALSMALRKEGFGFVGPTTMHALMEATGLLDTHLIGCHRRGIGGEFVDAVP